MTQLIEKQGKHYKEVDVVIIETKEKTSSTIMLGVMPNVSALTKDVLDDIHDWMVFGRPQHLYFLSSDEEIKEGDWFITMDLKSIFQCGKFQPMKGDKKIIAATDESLIIEGECKIRSGKNVEYYPTKSKLPQPSPEFIKAYIEAYNSGKPITRVLVEYNNTQDYEFPAYPNPVWLKLKDNQIICKKVEEKTYTQSQVDNMLDQQAAKTTAQILENQKRMYSEGEVEYLMKKSFVMGSSKTITNVEDRDNWIKQNLKQGS